MAGAAKQLLRLGVLAVLARLLSPEDFGIVAMLTAVFAMAAVVQQLGLSAATVQRERISAQALSTLFWINSLLGAAMTLAFVLLAPLLADFFGRPELTTLCRVAALSFVLSGAAVQHLALLQRAMQFGTQAGIDFASALLGSLAAVLLALQGWGYWALAGQVLASDATVLLLVLKASRFLPSRPAWSKEVRELLSYGGSLFGFNLLGSVAQNLSVALLGRSVGAAAAGSYTRGFVLASVAQGFINGAAAHVALAKLSKVRGNDAAFADFYYRGVQLLALVTAPMALAFALLGDQIAALAYGPQWGETGALLRIFAVGMAVQPILHSTGQVFLARGETRRMLLWGMVGWTLMGISTVVGLHWGVKGVAWGWSLSLLLLLWPCISYTFRGTPITAAGVLRVVAGPYAAALCTVPLGLLLHHLLAGTSVWHQLPAILLACLGVYLLLGYGVFGQKAMIKSVLAALSRR